MMVKHFGILSVALVIAAPAVLAQQPGKAPGPCEQIVQACESAGFVYGDAKKGYGLWRDCVDPIMRGTAQPANADKPLPQVPSEVVGACKQKHPNFGMGKHASQPPKET